MIFGNTLRLPPLNVSVVLSLTRGVYFSLNTPVSSFIKNRPEQESCTQGGGGGMNRETQMGWMDGMGWDGWMDGRMDGGRNR